MASLGLNLLGQFHRRLAGGRKFQRGGGIVAGLAQVVGRKIEPAQHKIRFGARSQFQRLVSLHPGAIGVAERSRTWASPAWASAQLPSAATAA